VTTQKDPDLPGLSTSTNHNHTRKRKRDSQSQGQEKEKWYLQWNLQQNEKSNHFGREMKKKFQRYLSMERRCCHPCEIHWSEKMNKKEHKKAQQWMKIKGNHIPL
jgi:hypothetical protein